MEQIPSEVNPLFVPAIVKTRQSGGIRVNMWGVGGEPGTPECEHFYVEVENVGDPDDKEFNFSLWGPDMIALQGISRQFKDLPKKEQANHIFDHPCAYKKAKERYERKRAV